MSVVAFQKEAAELKPVLFSMERWVSVRALLIPAIELLGGAFDEMDVVYLLMTGKMSLWIYKNSAAITEVREFPRLKELLVFAAGGDMDDVMSMKPSFEKYGKINGCSRARIDGRKGWEKMHPDYKFFGISLVKEI